MYFGYKDVDSRHAFNELHIFFLILHVFYIGVLFSQNQLNLKVPNFAV